MECNFISLGIHYVGHKPMLPDIGFWHDYLATCTLDPTSSSIINLFEQVGMGAYSDKSDYLWTLHLKPNYQQIWFYVAFPIVLIIPLQSMWPHFFWNSLYTFFTQ